MANQNDKPDPTKEPEFQKVVKHFLNTPPQPRGKPNKDKESESKKPGRPALTKPK